jgi:hypothetical protein
MKVLDLHDLLTVSETLELPGHDGYVDVFEKLVTSLADVIAKEKGIVVARPGEWMGKEFGGLCVSFAPSTPDQSCPEVIHDSDPSGDWTTKYERYD